MKTTLELPDTLFRKAKATAAARGQSLKDLFTEALHEKLSAPRKHANTLEPEWMLGFGTLKRLRTETARVQDIITREFDIVEPEDRA